MQKFNLSFLVFLISMVTYANGEVKFNELGEVGSLKIKGVKPKSNKGSILFTFGTFHTTDSKEVDFPFYLDKKMKKASPLKINVDGIFYGKKQLCWCGESKKKSNCALDGYLDCVKGIRVWNYVTDRGLGVTHRLIEVESYDEKIAAVKYDEKLHYLNLENHSGVAYVQSKDDRLALEKRKISQFYDDKEFKTFKKLLMGCFNSSDLTCLKDFINFESFLSPINLDDSRGRYCVELVKDGQGNIEEKATRCFAKGERVQEVVRSCLAQRISYPKIKINEDITYVEMDLYEEGISGPFCFFGKENGRWQLHQIYKHEPPEGC